MTDAAWHPDPTGRHELRYWDGSQWTEHVADQGVQSTSPVVLEPAGQPDNGSSSGSGSGAGDARESADAGSEASADGGAPVEEHAPGQAEPMQAQPMQAQPMQAQPAHAQPMGQQMGGPMGGPPMGQPMGQPPMGQPGPQAYGDAFAGISGELIDGRYSEVDGAGPQLQGHKMLRVRITEPFMAKQGSMVAYQGNVNFAYQGSGAAKFLKKAVTGEGLSLMRVEGQGDVFLAELAADVHILHLNNSGLSVSGKNILAFSSSLEWNVERVKGGSIMAGGLFNTTLRGTGWVAITTEGTPVVLNAQEAPTFADGQALVAWSVQLQTSIRSTMSAGALIGRGSGEAFQVSFQGPGFVIVQPSEGYPMPTGG